MKVKAAVVYSPKEGFVVEEVDLSLPQNNEVLIRMVASGVCHSDHDRAVGNRPTPFPIILGHEGAGIVECVGPGVTTVKPGDRVILAWLAPCGKCRYCSTGRMNLCIEARKVQASGYLFDGTTRFSKNGQDIHVMTGTGTFAEYSVVHENACVPIPQEMPFKTAALIGCAVTTGIGAVTNRAGVRPGSSVVVYGVGGVGLNCIQGARLVNAETIIAVDVADWKLELAQRFGATHTVNAKQGNPVDRIREITGGDGEYAGVDFALDAVGFPETIRQAYDSVHRGGVVVVVGIAPAGQDVSLPALSLPFHEKILTGSLYGSGSVRLDFPMLSRQYLKGNIMLDELISKTYTLEEINEAFNDLENGSLARGVIIF